MQKNIQISSAKILIMGLTFKENCPDLRNTRVIDVITELNDYGCEADVYDPWVNSIDARDEHNFEILDTMKNDHYDAIIVAVAHTQFLKRWVR